MKTILIINLLQLILGQVQGGSLFYNFLATN